MNFLWDKNHGDANAAVSGGIRHVLKGALCG